MGEIDDLFVEILSTMNKKEKLDKDDIFKLAICLDDIDLIDRDEMSKDEVHKLLVCEQEDDEDLLDMLKKNNKYRFEYVDSEGDLFDTIRDQVNISKYLDSTNDLSEFTISCDNLKINIKK